MKVNFVPVAAEPVLYYDDLNMGDVFKWNFDGAIKDICQKLGDKFLILVTNGGSRYKQFQLVDNFPHSRDYMSRVKKLQATLEISEAP